MTEFEIEVQDRLKQASDNRALVNAAKSFISSSIESIFLQLVLARPSNHSVSAGYVRYAGAGFSH